MITAVYAGDVRQAAMEAAAHVASGAAHLTPAQRERAINEAASQARVVWCGNIALQQKYT